MIKKYKIKTNWKEDKIRQFFKTITYVFPLYVYYFLNNKCVKRLYWIIYELVTPEKQPFLINS